MPRPYDLLNPIETTPGSAAGPEGPSGPPGPPSNQPFDLQIFSGEYGTTSDFATRAGSRYLDLTPYPPIDSAGRTRQIEFVANLEVGTAGTGYVQLRNRDDDELVTGASLSTASLTNVELRSGPLTVGTLAGNLKDDKMYEVEVYHLGGSSTDGVTITNARLEVVYV